MTDHIIKEGDKVYVFGSTSMYEYRWINVNGNELLDLFKVWQANFITEKIKDRLRVATKGINQTR